MEKRPGTNLQIARDNSTYMKSNEKNIYRRIATLSKRVNYHENERMFALFQIFFQLLQKYAFYAMYVLNIFIAFAYLSGFFFTHSLSLPISIWKKMHLYIYNCEEISLAIMRTEVRALECVGSQENFYQTNSYNETAPIPLVNRNLMEFFLEKREKESASKREQKRTTIY